MTSCFAANTASVSDFQVSTRHVSEAYNLLNKSIIRVEQPDIVLNEDIDEPATVNDELAPGE